MNDWHISDAEIESVERILLPDGCSFADDAKEVIKCWGSSEISACPGSGKTTVLLAKLKFLADRMPFENNAGICVLSHTNVAVNEIKSKLTDDANKLMNYPNYVGTIQSFIDHYITFPYLRTITSESIQVVDDKTYAQCLFGFLCKNRNTYGSILYLIKKRYEQSGAKYKDIYDYAKGFYLKNGALHHIGQKQAIAGKESISAKQYYESKLDLLKKDGMLTYKDAYSYASQAILARNELPNLLSTRFRYVFIDEFQDCSQTQRSVLSCAFDETVCSVFKIGDPDQAIYSSDKEDTEDWKPSEKVLQIASTNRYSQEIADILYQLRSEKQKINSLRGKTGIIPTVIIYDDKTKPHVLSSFISLLEAHGLTDPNGTYKAIGWIKNESSKGLKIGDYWDGFSSKTTELSEINYWKMIDAICEKLRQGKIYRVETIVRRLLCRVLHYVGCKDKNEHPVTISSIKDILDDEYYNIYRDGVRSLSFISTFSKTEVDKVIRSLTNNLLKNDEPIDVFSRLPKYFIEDTAQSVIEKSNDNIFIDPIRGRKIQFSTVHKVKGETHDATLYLETETSGSSDIKRIVPYYNGTKPGATAIHNYSRKCVYVGFSRPRTLLCVAMHENTYSKSGKAFSAWEIHDCRNTEKES